MKRSQRHLIGAILSVAMLMLLPPSASASSPQASKREKITLKNTLFERERRIEALILSANRYLNNGLDADADKAIEEAIGIDPQRAQTHFAVGNMFMSNGRAWRAKPFLNRYLELARDRGESSWAEAHIHLGQMAYDEYLSQTTMREYSQHFLQQAETHLLAAHEALYEPERRYDLARVEELLLRVTYARKNYPAALRYLRAMRSHASHIDPHESLRQEARVLIAMDRGEEALAIAEQLPTGRLDDGEGRLDLGALENSMLLVNCYRELGQYDLALGILDWLEQEFQDDGFQPMNGPNPLLMYIYERKASTHFDARDFQAAIEYQRRLLDMQPTDATRMNNLAWMMAIAASPRDHEMLQDALRLSEQAVQEQPNGAHLDTLAEVYLRLGRYHDALEVIDRALRLHPNEGYLKDQRTRIQSVQGGFMQPQQRGSMMRFQQWAPPEGDLNL